MHIVVIKCFSLIHNYVEYRDMSMPVVCLFIYLIIYLFIYLLSFVVIDYLLTASVWLLMYCRRCTQHWRR